MDAIVTARVPVAVKEQVGSLLRDGCNWLVAFAAGILIGAFGLHLHPLFFAPLQKGDGHDAVGIRLQREGAGRAPQRPLSGGQSSVLHKRTSLREQ